jgi:RNA polymerase sigma-70 factor (ECF subfamily)
MSVVQDAAAGAFMELYRREFTYVWHTLRRLGIAAADLEDAAQEVFLVVHRRLGEYDPARPLRPWLFGIAFRVAADDRRRTRRTGAMPPTLDPADSAPGPEERLAAKEARSMVTAALEGIELDQRAVFVMHDVDGHGAPDIAAALDLPLNTVYSRLRLAREKFALAVKRLSTPRGRT